MDSAVARPLVLFPHSPIRQFVTESSPAARPSTGSHTEAVCDDASGCTADVVGAFFCPLPGDTETSGRVWQYVFMPDGSAYPGDLVDDILDYRKLRARALAGHPLDRARARRLEVLEERLRSRDVPHAEGRTHVRAYHRFDVSARAKLRLRVNEGRRLIDVQVANLSAGGAKIELDSQLEPGSVVWLALQQGRSVVILPSRVAWSARGQAGLMFAGGPASR